MCARSVPSHLFAQKKDIFRNLIEGSTTCTAPYRGSLHNGFMTCHDRSRPAEQLSRVTIQPWVRVNVWFRRVYRCQPARERRSPRKARVLARGPLQLFERGQGGPAGSSLMQRKAALSLSLWSGCGSLSQERFRGFSGEGGEGGRGRSLPGPSEYWRRRN